MCVGDSRYAETVGGVSIHGLFALFPIRFSCYSYRRRERREKLIALSYADVIFVQMHLQNNSFFSTSATAYFHSGLFNMKSHRLTQGAFVSHAKTWSALDRAKQLRTGRQLHYCLRVTDGWHRWQTRWINWQGYAKETSLRFGFPGVSRCIFSQMRCCTAVCGIWFHMWKASRCRSAIFVRGSEDMIGMSDDNSTITPEKFCWKEKGLLFGGLFSFRDCLLLCFFTKTSNVVKMFCLVKKSLSNISLGCKMNRPCPDPAFRNKSCSDIPEENLKAICHETQASSQIYTADKPID